MPAGTEALFSDDTYQYARNNYLRAVKTGTTSVARGWLYSTNNKQSTAYGSSVTPSCCLHTCACVWLFRITSVSASKPQT